MVTLRNVILSWISRGFESGDLEVFNPEQQREFGADLMAAETEWFWDAINEGFHRKPLKISEFKEHFRNGDFMQMGAVLDNVIRRYLFDNDEGGCGDLLLHEFITVEEQEAPYEGDC